MTSIDNYLNRRSEQQCAEIAAKFQSAYPYPHVAIDDFFSQSFIEALSADFPRRADPDYARHCMEDGGQIGENYANADASSFPPAFKALDKLSGTPEFLRYLTMLTGIPLLLLDEPFAALDALTRAEMHRWLQDVIPSGERTTLLVTHDVEEALLLADRIVVVSPRPAHVVAIEPVTFARPRRRALALAPEFLAARARILIHLGTGTAR